MPPNNPDLNPADYSILENLAQRLYKHQRIRDMQHMKDLLEEKREKLPQYESDACINQFKKLGEWACLPPCCGCCCLESASLCSIAARKREKVHDLAAKLAFLKTILTAK